VHLDFGAVWPEILLAGTGLLIVLIEPFLRGGSGRWLGWLGVAGVLVALWATGAGAGARGVVLGGMVVLDPTSTFFRTLFLLASLIVLLTSFDYIEARGARVGEFTALILFATTGADFMAISWDVVSLFVGLELLSVPSYVLAGFLRRDDRSNEAGLKYFLNGALASAVLLFGLSLAYGLTGQTGLGPMARGLAVALRGPLAPVALPAVGLVLGALAFKIAAVPFHLWAPDTYEGAPTPFGGYLAAVSEAAGFAALLRVVLTGMAPLSGAFGPWLAALAVLTMTVGNVTALRQTNIKRMMGYSSVAQVGYILAGVALVTRAGVFSVLFYLLAYLFMVLGTFAIISTLGARGQGDRIVDYEGLSRRSPWLAGLLTLFFASLIGIPTTAGFMGKLNLFAAAAGGGMAWLAVVIALNSAISVGYYWSVVRAMWLRPGAAEAEEQAAGAPQPRAATSPAMSLGLAVATAGVLVLGLAPNAFLLFAHLAAFVPR
jgi:NADH-quinone oxidoreductase subunit N